MDASAQSVYGPSSQEQPPATPTRRGLMSPPAADAAQEKVLRVALSLGTPTSDMVALSLNGAVAAVRSGEVASVELKRVLRLDRTAPPSVATSVADLTPKRLAKPHSKVLYF